MSEDETIGLILLGAAIYFFVVNKSVAATATAAAGVGVNQAISADISGAVAGIGTDIGAAADYSSLFPPALAAAGAMD
jgi:hypothetical protein